MNSYVTVLKNYAGFSGRARRTEYWMFFLFNIVIIFVLAVIDSLIGQKTLLTSLYALAVLIPSFAVTVRRLHDTGRSAWWLLINLVPPIGSITLLVFMASEGEPGNNAYGPNPELEPASTQS